MSRTKLATRLLAGVALTTMLAGVAFAAEDQASGTTVGEVIVTSNKRAERIQDVSMSVSAVTADQLQRYQVTDLQDLQSQVAGLNLVQGGGADNSSRIILRGLNTGGAGSEVATVVDDVPLSFSSAVATNAYFASDFDPYDLSRVEVLRGPQGTLYGATAEGGLIKYVTTAPSSDGFHAGVEASAFSLSHGGVGGSGKGFVNLPMGDTLAFRGSAYYEDTPGWIDNNLAGIKDQNVNRRYGGRAALEWKPTAEFTLRLSAMYQRNKSDGANVVESSPFASPDRFKPAFGYVWNTYLPNVFDNKAQLYAATINYDLGGVRLESITSYGRLDFVSGADTPFYGNLFGPGTTIYFDASTALKKFNEEFRLASPIGFQLNGHQTEWQAGLFYTKEDATFVENFNQRQFPSGALGPLGSTLFADLPATYQEIAFYADGTYHFTPTFDVEAGARVFQNKQHSQQTVGGLFVGHPNQTEAPIHSSESSYTYSFAPRWHISPNQMFYARIASGYRPGGPEPLIANADVPVPDSFTSDHTVNYEVGFKGDLFDRKVSLDLAVFYIDWSKVQVNEQITINHATAAANITVNGAKAYSEGFEWNLIWQPVHGLSLGTTGTYNKTDITSGVPQIPGSAGAALPYVPKWSGNINASYEWPAFGDYNGFVGGTWFYVGSRYSGFAAPRPGVPAGHQLLPSYSTLQMQVGIENAKYKVQLFARNLTDSRGLTSYSPFGADTSLFVYGTEGLIRPRTVGVLVSAKF